MSSIVEMRKEAFIAWLETQPGRFTIQPNERIAEQLDEFVNGRVGAVRVSEIIRDLEAEGYVEIERGRRHPQNNPAGRLVRMIETRNDPF
jgi:hypothetical protein